MQTITDLIVRMNAFLWGVPMLALIAGAGVYFTWKLKFIQRHLLRSVSLSVQESRAAGSVSGFGALVLALAAMVGTGNIVGVAAAVSTGGAGALFWMMLSAVFAMAVKYAEAVLAVKYREKNETGEYVGGPMYVLKNGLNMPKWAVIFAGATALMGFGDALIQTNSLVAVYNSVLNVPAGWTTGIAVLLTGTVILGGIKQIVAVCKWLVPFMAVLYMLLCLWILVTHLPQLPDALWRIIREAFTGSAALGGAVGVTVKEAVRYGVSRGVLSNEAGSGSGAIAAAAAKTPNPVRQGLISATTVFWDTLVICFLSGVAVVVAGNFSGGLFGAELAQSAFSSVTGGPVLLLAALTLFAFSTLVGWSYYTAAAVRFVVRGKVEKPVYWMWLVVMGVGGFLSPKLVWELADTAIAVMCIPNLLSLWLLRGEVVSETKKYLADELTQNTR
ncbi:MAG: alanine/glycine:cation symporter family protein [Candidatus Avelusimicrobium sp.]|uniref:alanine/glycine:cation symporter family protein n=1 Tax=Candidatus Avelusimicrobium sp. TaxID=3048833 RepID=UPI003EFF138B